MTERHHRRSIRLSDYDYAEDGVYAVTICTDERECCFGEVAGAAMVLNEWGRVTEDCWNAIPVHFPQVELDAFVVMPNHVHGIIVINRGSIATPNAVDKDQDGGGQVGARDVGAQHVAPLQKRGVTPNNVKSGSLGAIVRAYKGAVSKRINEWRDTPGAPLWQRNYYEQVVHTEKMLNALREYIDANPANWAHDQENRR